MHLPAVTAPTVWKPSCCRSLGLRIRAQDGAYRERQGLGSAFIPQAAVTDHTSRSPAFARAGRAGRCSWSALLPLPLPAGSPSASRPRCCLRLKASLQHTPSPCLCTITQCSACVPIDTCFCLHLRPLQGTLQRNTWPPLLTLSGQGSPGPGRCVLGERVS